LGGISNKKLKFMQIYASWEELEKSREVQGATSAPELLQPKLFAQSARLKNFCLLTK